MKLDILAIGVHPDDVELSAAGTILKHIAFGKKVGILDLTLGELGTRGSAQLRTQEAMKSAERTGSFSPKKNPEMAPVIENIKKGAYGQEVKDIFTGKKGMRGKNTKPNYKKSLNRINDGIKNNKSSSFKSKGLVAGNVLQIIQPFASTYFSEKAREHAAMYAELDMSNSVSVNALNN